MRYSFERALTQFMSINRNVITPVQIHFNTLEEFQSYFSAMDKSHHNNSGLHSGQISTKSNSEKFHQMSGTMQA